MKLTDDQISMLGDRIFDAMGGWFDDEMTFQMEYMKDNDELDWNYYLDPADNMKVLRLVQKLVAEDLGVTVD